METLKEISIFYLLLIDVITDSSNIFFVKTNETINLDNFMVCDNWMKDTEPVPKTFAMLRENIGYYYCSTTIGTSIFIFTIDKDMTFEFMPVQQSFIVGDNVKLSCYVTFQANLHYIETQTTISDSNKYITAANNSVYNRKYEKELNGFIKIDTSGTKTYFCTWSFNVNFMPYKGEVIKSISFRVYMPPTNVRPDATKAQVNVTRIICLSDADPPPSKYSWNCVNGISWSSNGSSIIFHRIGIYSCICSVENNINGKVYRSQWNGTIEVTSKGSSNMFFAKTNETINLDKFMACDNWMKDNEPQPKTFVMLIENIGYYYCSSSKTNIFIFTVDKDMIFEFMPVQQSFIVGDNVKLSCYVTFQTTIHVIETQTNISDSSNKYINAANDSVYNRKYEKEVNGFIHLDSNGIKTYICNWSFSIKNTQYKGEVIKSISFRVCMPPTNVRPDATKAQVNVTRIFCLSEADPPPSKYSWNCVNGISWSSNDSSIIFHRIGIYSCICSVENDISGTLYSSQWNGTIDVTSKEVYEKDASSQLNASSIIGIVLGILAGLALVAVIVGILMWKFMKICGHLKKNEPMDKTENSGYENYTVQHVPSHLYEQLSRAS